MLLGDTLLINTLMRDKVGNYIRVFYVTCQWKAEVQFGGKPDRELKLQAVLSKTEEQLALSCILRHQRVWQGASSAVAARSVHQQGSDGSWGKMGSSFFPYVPGPVAEPIAQALLLASVEEDVCELPLKELVPAVCFSHLLPASLGCTTTALGMCGKLDQRSSWAENLPAKRE